MIIGLISDTHIAFSRDALPPEIKDAFSGVDLILHAGDIWIPSVLDELESVAPVMAAWGDDDMEADLGDDSRMMKGHTLHLDGVTLWLTHVKPPAGLLDPKEKFYSLRPSWLPYVRPPYGLLNPKEELSHSSPEDPEDRPDVVVFGHTHFPAIEPYKDILLVNPGSATVPSYVPKLGTVALLTISSGEAEARIVQLE